MRKFGSFEPGNTTHKTINTVDKTPDTVSATTPRKSFTQVQWEDNELEELRALAKMNDRPLAAQIRYMVRKAKEAGMT